MPRFAIPVILSLLLLPALLTACAAEPTPIPTPTPPAWLGAAEEYADLAQEVVKDTLADVDFAFAAMSDTEKSTVSVSERPKLAWSLPLPVRHSTNPNSMTPVERSTGQRR